MRFFTVCHSPRFSSDRYIDGHAIELACYLDERDACEAMLEYSIWFPSYVGRYITVEHNTCSP